MAPVINEICAYHFFLCMILFISINIIIPDIFIKNKRSILVVYQVDMFTHTKPLERKLRTQGALSIDFTRFYRLSNFTTVSTWPEFSQPMSDDRFFILRLRKQVNWFRSMREYIIDIEVLGNMSIEDK